jgi:hypothetical protein
MTARAIPQYQVQLDLFRETWPKCGRSTSPYCQGELVIDPTGRSFYQCIACGCESPDRGYSNV